MRDIRQVKRYECDYCKRTGIKQSMNVHEPSCFYNPNRTCGNRLPHTVPLDNDYAGLVIGSYSELPVGACKYCAKYSEFLMERMKLTIREFKALPLEERVQRLLAAKRFYDRDGEDSQS